MNASERSTEDTMWWHAVKWPAIVAVLLAGHVFIVTGALLLSSTWIPGASTRPLEFGDELRWDDLQTLRDASEDLGWSLEVAPTEVTELNGDRQVRFVLRDALGEPIRDASLRVAMYHHSRPNRPVEFAFQPDLTSDARVAALDIDREGAWHISALASREEYQFLVETDLWVGKRIEGWR